MSQENQEKKGKRDDIRWHPAFYEAIKADLAPYAAVLEFECEHSLAVDLLSIDVIVIKNVEGVVIYNPIGLLVLMCLYNS